MSLPNEFFFVDSGVKYTGDAISVMTGLDHLEGESVSVLADGRVESPDADGNFKVVSGGVVSLDAPANEVVAGIPLESYGETLPIDVGDGQLQPPKKRIVRVYFKIVETAGRFRLSASETSEETEFSSALLAKGVYKSPLTGSYTRDGKFKWRMIDPTPYTILAMYPEIDV